MNSQAPPLPPGLLAQHLQGGTVLSALQTSPLLWLSPPKITAPLPHTSKNPYAFCVATPEAGEQQGPPHHGAAVAVVPMDADAGTFAAPVCSAAAENDFSQAPTRGAPGRVLPSCWGTNARSAALQQKAPTPLPAFVQRRRGEVCLLPAPQSPHE